MLCAALAAGERPGAARWAGMALALAGLVWLLLPGLHAPPLPAALCMGVAGAAWGAYSLLTAAAAVPLLGETIGLRLVLSRLLVLGGIALALRRPG